MNKYYIEHIPDLDKRIGQHRSIHEIQLDIDQIHEESRELLYKRDENQQPYKEELEAASEAWRNRRFSFLNLDAEYLSSGGWLIELGKIDVDSGIYFHGKSSSDKENIVAALNKTYGDSTFHVTNHGSTFHVWRYS